MITRYIYPIILGFFLLNACVEVDENTQLVEKPYFDLPAFTQEQIDLLDSLSKMETSAPQVTKEVLLKGGEEKIQLNPNDENYPVWEKELQLFKEADINKPVLLQAYDIDEGADYKTYKANQEDLSIQEIKVSYEAEAVSEIYLRLNEENYLYTSYKDLVMKLQSGHITEIDIKGFRKLVGNDALEYHVKTHLTFPRTFGSL
ncbi:hypothetical protein [Chondrinema litorale]|uniref:hypothetical protein n=1 Tax=Chondrinema litorale TaxID=2994555 RepID=UPI002543E5CD|nr:hypothetical protein [Chondrinema litorale]UZR92677.1 hypothetical protein OQ292_12495 [Chondrinema litorale]